MGIDITIAQKFLGKKTMPLDVILGNTLHYGYWENDKLTVGKLGGTEFVAFDPNAIGRGFSVIWNPQEKKRISLRLPIPSTSGEIRAFFDTVARMSRFWGGTLTVDGTRQKLDTFLTTQDDMLRFNRRVLLDMSDKILHGEHDSLTLPSAMWPMTIGKEEAEAIQIDPDSFEKWLHAKQSMDIFYSNPSFFTTKDGILAQFMLVNDRPTVFPYKPTVPFGLVDPGTGKALKCSDWRVVPIIQAEKVPLRQIKYPVFLERIPEEKKIRYDGNHFLIAPLTEAEVRSFAEM